MVADLDGTLLGLDFSISRATVDALDLLRREAIHLVIATARTPPGLEQLTELAERTEVAVCCSGAIGWSTVHKRRLWIERLDPEVVQMAVDVALSARAGVAGFDGEVWKMTDLYDSMSPGQPHGPVRQAAEPAEIAASNLCTVAVRHARVECLEKLRDEIGTQANAAISKVAASCILDVVPSGVDKGSGTLRALRQLGVDPRSAVSFGDMPNDVPMFAVTGRGYAVGSEPFTAAAADEVLHGVDRDGFAVKIASLAESGWLLV